MKKIIFIGLTFCLMLIACSFGSGNSKYQVKVLFVGYNPERPMPEYKGNKFSKEWEKQFYIDEYATRMPAFKQLLETYFTDVTIIDARDYKQTDSKSYDVTVFDELPRQIKKMVAEYDENGQVTKYEPAHYITEDFDCASICIASVAPRMGEPIGIKLDWQCECLDADAYHLNIEHPIFNTPFKVNPTMKIKDTPKNVFGYPSSMGVPKQLPMWRVQKEGYMDGKEGASSGLVSHCAGFLDSPDTEIISGGVSLKDIGAIAIGRHANFFMWGFSASPKGMTEEAKLAFVNAVYYMKDFNGIKPLTRKFGRQIQTRDELLNWRKYSVSREKFKKIERNFLRKNKLKITKCNALEEKVANGEELSASEKFYLKKNKVEKPSLESYLKKKMGAKYAIFGNDIEAYHASIEKDREYYFYSKEGGFAIDKDAQKLGISNREVQVLDKCVELLKNNEQTDLARRILLRYTDESFASPVEWENWLKTNREKLFFTDSGGYKWMIDIYKK